MLTNVQLRRLSKAAEAKTSGWSWSGTGTLNVCGPLGTAIATIAKELRTSRGRVVAALLDPGLRARA